MIRPPAVRFTMMSILLPVELRKQLDSMFPGLNGKGMVPVHPNLDQRDEYIVGAIQRALDLGLTLDSMNPTRHQSVSVTTGGKPDVRLPSSRTEAPR